MRNLEGSIVKYYVSEQESKMDNNQQIVCPALVTVDWGHTSPVEDKCLNLKVFFDGNGDNHVTSVVHKSLKSIPKDQESNGFDYDCSWELYDRDKTDIIEGDK